jgi:hypothetical protein
MSRAKWFNPTLRFPQITLRDLFWLILVVGLLLGWWVDRRNLTRPRVRALQTSMDVGNVKAGTTVQCDFEIQNVGYAPASIMPSSMSLHFTCFQPLRMLQPGESCMVPVMWQVKAGGPDRRSGVVKLWTNDPRQPQIELTVTGRVEQAQTP